MVIVQRRTSTVNAWHARRGGCLRWIGQAGDRGYGQRSDDVSRRPCTRQRVASARRAWACDCQKTGIEGRNDLG